MGRGMVGGGCPIRTPEVWKQSAGPNPTASSLPPAAGCADLCRGDDRTMKVAPPNISRVAERSRLLLRRQCGPSARPGVCEASALVVAPGACDRKPHLLRHLSSDSDRSEALGESRDRIHLLTEKFSCPSRTAVTEDLRSKVAALAEELLALPDDRDLDAVLCSSSAPAFLRDTSDVTPFLELLGLLSSRPLLALEVLPPAVVSGQSIYIFAIKPQSRIAVVGLPIGLIIWCYSFP